ncbi:MAG: hypothetical protein R3D58_18085 [Saprospiraceae bacterium]
MKTMYRWAGLIMVLSIFLPQLHAATILTGESVQVTNPIDGNVYAAGGKIHISAPINGDLTAGAGEITVFDTIRRDVLVGGGRVRIEGVIGDDLRCGGGEVWLLGDVYGDVVVGSGQLEVGRNAVIHGDLVVGGGEVRMYGRVMGAVIMAGGRVTFEGEAEKDVEIRGGEITLDGIFRGPAEIAATDLKLGQRAEFYGPVRYWRPDGELDFGSSLRDGARASFDTSLKQDMDYDKGWFSRGFSFFSIYRLLAGALLVVVLLLLFERFFQRSAEGLPAQWLNRFGMGMLYLIGLPVAVIFLLITVIGIPFGVFALLFYIFTLVFAPALTATVGANALEQYRGLSWTKGQRILAALGILVLLRLLSWVPVIGWLAVLVLVSIAFGCLLKAMLARQTA